MPAIPEGTNILLLDEVMPLTGTEIFDGLCHFSGVVASISGGDRPDYAHWHFQEKSSLQRSPATARRFVHFFNSLLENLS